MPQFFVVKPDGSRLGPFDGPTISQMRLDGAIGVEDLVEEAKPDAEAAQVPIEAYFAKKPEAAKKTNPIFWWLIGACVLCIPCIAIFAAVLFPVFSQAKQSAQMNVTMKSLKKVGEAMTVYLTDNDDMFPPKMGTLAETWPGLKKYMTGDMPESSNPGHPEFSGNDTLAGQAATKIVGLQRTYEFFDSSPWPGSKRMVLFVDTSVKKVDETVFQASLANGMVEK